jgi:hypothetical protein
MAKSGGIVAGASLGVGIARLANVTPILPLASSSTTGLSDAIYGPPEALSPTVPSATTAPSASAVSALPAPAPSPPVGDSGLLFRNEVDSAAADGDNRHQTEDEKPIATTDVDRLCGALENAISIKPALFLLSLSFEKSCALSHNILSILGSRQKTRRNGCH